MAVYQETHTKRTADEVDEVPVTARQEYHMNVAARIVYLIGSIIIALLGIRFLLALFGANPANSFANFIYDVSHPFAAPFFGLFGYDQTLGRSTFEAGTLVGIIVYGLVMLLLVRIVTIGSR